MTINYTTLLGLAEPVTGTESGTWGDDVNNGITVYVDVAIAGTNNITNDLDITLSITNGSSAGSNLVASPNSTTAQYMHLLCTGARTANRYINAPNSSKMFVVNNSTSGGYSIIVRGVTGPTTGVTIVNGEKAIIFWNSVAGDFVKISNTNGVATFSSITDTSLTSGRVTYAGTGGLLQDSANLTFNGTTLTANTLNLTNALGTAYGGTGLTSFTANGVVYASSTSALTTGSALQFDGTNLGVGIAPTVFSNSTRVFINGTSSATTEYYIGGTATNYIYSNSSVMDIGTRVSSPITFTVANSEQMRLNSTGLGIGSTTTLSTKGKLGVYGTGDQTEEGTATATFGSWDSGGMRMYFGVNNTNEYTYIGSVKSATGYRSLVLQPNGGNLGLGVTPSAWYSNRKVEQIGGGVSLAGISGSAGLELRNNAYLNSGGTETYLNTDYATLYASFSGQHRWYNAPSGTAGDAITFTQALTLFASGGMSLGNTSDPGAANLSVTGTINSTTGTTASLGSAGTATILTPTNLSHWMLTANGNSNTTQFAQVMVYTNAAGGVTVTSIVSAGITISASGANTVIVTNGGTTQTISYAAIRIK